LEEQPKWTSSTVTNMGNITCDACGGNVHTTDVPFQLHGEHLGNFPAEVCKQCGEKVFNEETADRIDTIAQQRGLWNLTSKTKVGQVGTALGITISKRITEFLQLSKGKNVMIYPENKKKIIVELLD